MKSLRLLILALVVGVLFNCAVDAQNIPLNVVSYHCQTFSCSNTTAETTVFLDTLYNGTWTNEAIVDLSMTVFTKQNSGGSVNMTIKVKVDGQTVTTLNGAVTTNSALEGWNWRGIVMKRDNDTVAMFASSGAPAIFTVGLGQGFPSTNSFANQALTGLNFGTDKIIEVTVQWSVASPNVYFKAESGKVIFTP